MTLSFPTRFLSLSLLTLSLATTGCGPMAEPEGERSPQVSEEAGAPSDAEGEVSAMAECPELCGGQCVAYARCKAPGLPSGLNSWGDKKRIANSNHAHEGCVALIDTGSAYGHVAYVSEVRHNPNGITIREANWKAGHCSLREGTKSNLNVYNYWCPKSLHTSTCDGPL